MKQWWSISLGIVTAMGGFLDASTIATAGEAGSRFGLGLVWALVFATLAVMLLIKMVGRFSSVSHKPYAAAIRENFGLRFFLLPLCSEIIAESLLLAAELGGMAIALSLVMGISWRVFFPFAGLLVLLLTWRAPFAWIENLPALLGMGMLSFFSLTLPNSHECSCLCGQTHQWALAERGYDGRPGHGFPGCPRITALRHFEWRRIKRMFCNHQQLFLRDIIDAQLESADHRALGRVADIEVEVRENGCLALTALLTGPQAGAGRVAGGLRRVCAWVLRDRFESRIPLEEVRAFGPTIILRKQAREYQVGQSERWIVRHLLRWIPGSGD